MRVALATCKTLPEPDPDAEPLLRALRAQGVDACELAWDDVQCDFSAIDLTLLRATWNYPQYPTEFLTWIGRVSEHTALWNPAEVVRWNHHKGYLLDLACRGLPIVPTELVLAGSTESLRSVCQRRGYSHAVVVKPAIGAGSFGARVFADAHQGEAHLTELRQRGDVLVQPYLSSITERGERSLIWIDGEITHAIRKAPRFAGQQEQIDAVTDLSSAERALAESIFGALDLEVFYGRVDLVHDEDGELRVMELELIEPSLYFGHSASSLERFVAGTLARLCALERSRIDARTR